MNGLAGFALREPKLASVSCAPRRRPARLKDKRDDGKGSNDLDRVCRARNRIEAAPVRRSPAYHRAHRRGALAWRPVGEREQSHNEGRIAEIEDKLARADIIDITKLSGDTIKFGATVTLVDEDTEKKTVWQIVGEVEADAKKGRISITSPLARALIGKKKGASVEVMTPGGAKAYEITKVEWR